MLSKSFDEWNDEKKKLDQSGFETLIFHEREIWWCSIGLNLGDEQNGKNVLFERPVLVLRKFNRRIAWILPMSTKVKEGFYYHSLEYGGIYSSVSLSQLRLVSVKRFRRLVGTVSPYQFFLIQEKVIRLVRGVRQNETPQ